MEKAKRISDLHLESFREAHERGVKVALGTDSETSFNLHDGAALKLKLMMDAGMSAMDALKSATGKAAEVLGIDGRLGMPEEGKAADFIVLDENPLENIEILMNIDTVCKKGLPC